MKVHEQAGGQPRQTEVADELGLVDGQQTLDGLYLDDELGADDEVHPVAAFQLEAPCS